jgi:hypothetical protein
MRPLLAVIEDRPLDRSRVLHHRLRLDPAGEGARDSRHDRPGGPGDVIFAPGGVYAARDELDLASEMTMSPMKSALRNLTHDFASASRATSSMAS